MTTVGKMFSTRALAKIQELVSEVADDTSVNTVVKYRQHKAITYNPESQALGASAWTDYCELNAIKTDFKAFELATGFIESGDVRFIVFKGEVRNTPTTADRIVEMKNQAGTTFNIIAVNEDPLGIAYVFHCRRP